MCDKSHVGFNWVRVCRAEFDKGAFPFPKRINKFGREKQEISKKQHSVFWIPQEKSRNLFHSREVKENARVKAWALLYLAVRDFDPSPAVKLQPTLFFHTHLAGCLRKEIRVLPAIKFCINSILIKSFRCFPQGHNLHFFLLQIASD